MLGIRRLFLKLLDWVGCALKGNELDDAQSGSKSPLVFEGYVHGLQFYQYPLVWQGLRPGMKLELRAEPDNEYDLYAVAVYWADLKLGYLPRDGNISVALLLEQGENLIAEMNRVDPNHEEMWLMVDVWLDRDGEPWVRKVDRNVYEEAGFHFLDDG